MARTKLLSSSYFIGCIFFTLIAQEQLWQIFWLLVSFTPLPVLWIKRFFLGGTIITTFIWSSITVRIRIFLRYSNFRELFELDIFDVNGFRLVDKLKTDDGFDITNISFNKEEFVHISKFKAFILTLELMGIAQSLEYDILLIGSLLKNGLSEHVHHDFLIIEGRSEFSFVKLVTYL